MGTLTTAITQLLGLSNKKEHSPRMFVNPSSPLFSSFGRDIYASDIVKTAAHRIANEVSKCDIKSVIEKREPKQLFIANDDINAVLGSWVNPICTLRDFLYKLAWQTITNKNAFIYWSFDEVEIKGTSLVRRVTKGFYLLQPREVRIYPNGDEVRIELKTDKATFDMPYHDIIHIRHQYGQHDYLGGDKNGGFDARELIGNLRTMHIIKESIPKTIEASLGIKGLLSLKTVAEIDKRNVTRDELEANILDSRYGILVTDYEGDFTAININPTDIPSNVMTFLRDEILAPMGVSLPIYLGKYTDDEFAAFYQTAVEDILIAIQQAFTAVLFTPRERAFGNKIKVYDRLVQSLSFKARKDLVDMSIQPALLSRDEQRELLGFAPDGEPTRVSLNFIDTTIANTYQLELLKLKGKESEQDTDSDNTKKDKEKDEEDDNNADQSK